MEGFLVGGSHVGGLDVLGGGDGDMNTTFNIFNRGELFPYVATVDTSGFAYFNRGEVYPAIYYIAPAPEEEGNIVGKGGRKSWLASFYLIPAKRG